MRKFGKLVAVIAVFSLAPGVGTAWAAPTADEPTPMTTVAFSNMPAPAAAKAAAVATPPPSIRASVEALRQSSLVLLPSRLERAAEAAQSGGGRRMSSAAKAAIWIAAVTVTTVWAYKTFSVTRGTD